MDITVQYHIKSGNPDPERQNARFLSFKALRLKFRDVSAWSRVTSEAKKSKRRPLMGGGGVE